MDCCRAGGIGSSRWTTALWLVAGDVRLPSSALKVRLLGVLLPMVLVSSFKCRPHGMRPLGWSGTVSGQDVNKHS